MLLPWHSGGRSSTCLIAARSSRRSRTFPSHPLHPFVRSAATQRDNKCFLVFVMDGWRKRKQRACGRVSCSGDGVLLWFRNTALVQTPYGRIGHAPAILSKGMKEASAFFQAQSCHVWGCFSPVQLKRGWRGSSQKRCDLPQLRRAGVSNNLPHYRVSLSMLLQFLFPNRYPPSFFAYLICSVGVLEVDEESIRTVPREEAVETGQVLVHPHERLGCSCRSRCRRE